MNTIGNNIYENLELMSPDMQGWNGNSKVFPSLIERINPSTIIEVGTWKGQSAINMATTVKKLGLNTKIYCVDTWLGALEFWERLSHTPERDLLLKNGYPQIYYQFLSNVVHANVQNYIIPFPTTSLIGARYFKKAKIQAELIYIDASHDEEDVFADLVEYYEILTPGGIIFGDDFNAFVGVRMAINRFSEQNSISFEVLENNFWVISKPL